MIAEIGLLSLIFAFMFALLQAGMIFFEKEKQLVVYATRCQFIFISLAFLCLEICFINSDFSVNIVALNSHTEKPLLYKISAAWANHEGSMLLWLWILGGYGAVFSFYLKRLSSPVNIIPSPTPLPEGEGFKVTALAIHGFIQAGLLAFLLFTSNPFMRIALPPFEGNGLNPLLQDIGLAMHPPMLYMGYVGSGMAFSIGVALLIHGKISRDAAKIMRPWILIPWCFLSFGIGLGSWWAYRELGWGGYWFWDPVENASLLPWLSGTALLHANAVLEKRGKLGFWVVLLSIITFSLSLIGTFLVRSGIITSVHSFASDPSRGIFILGYIFVVTGGALCLFALKASKLEENSTLRPLSREGGIVLNNVFLLTACASVLLATIYPLAQALLGHNPVSIGAPYYNKTFFPLMAPLILLGGIGAVLPWRKADLRKSLKELFPAILAVLAAWLILFSMSDNKSWWLFIGVGLGVWLLLGTVIAVRKFNTSNLGMGVAHFGLGLVVLAITCSSLLKFEQELEIKKGETIQIDGFSLNYVGFEQKQAENYTSSRVYLNVTTQSGEKYQLIPERRLFSARKTETTEAALKSTLWSDVYVALRNGSEDKEINHIARITFYNTPMMFWLWVGIFMIGSGGGLSLIERLFRKFYT